MEKAETLMDAVLDLGLELDGAARTQQIEEFLDRMEVASRELETAAWGSQWLLGSTVLSNSQNLTGAATELYTCARQSVAGQPDVKPIQQLLDNCYVASDSLNKKAIIVLHLDMSQDLLPLPARVVIDNYAKP